MADALILARDVFFANPCVGRLLSDIVLTAMVDIQLGYDVFNCLDLMDNKPFLEPLKFNIGIISP
jgi:hypothetical protein